MKGIDIHNYAQRIESIRNRVKNSKTSERNKQLIFEFMRDCQTGRGGRKLTDARIVTKDVDSYFAKKFGLNGSEIKEQPKPGRYPRCKDVNAPGAGYCYKCGLPLSQKADSIEQQVQTMMEKLLANVGQESKTTDR
jgi:hypothetical protein